MGAASPSPGHPAREMREGETTKQRSQKAQLSGMSWPWQVKLEALQ